MGKYLTTREVARYLNVNEKMVYTLVSEKGLPASKITGKWVFPQHLVDQWMDANTINLAAATPIPAADGLLIISGSNDPLLEQTIGVFNSIYSDHLAVFGNLGSLGGIGALKRQLCHMATSHLLEENGQDYNFEIAGQQLSPMPVVVNFCRRCQGLVIAKGNPMGIKKTADLAKPGLRIVNRKLGTGTRQLFDKQLAEAQINSARLDGFHNEVDRHMDVGLAVLSGRAQAGPCIQPIAEQLGLGFIAWRWERYDLLIQKERFFNQPIQHFLGLLHENHFHKLAAMYPGYDTSDSGKMIFPAAPEHEGETAGK